MNSPVDHGDVTDWDDFEALLNHGISSLQNSNQDDNDPLRLIMTDSIRTPELQREQMCELAFEKFQVEGY